MYNAQTGETFTYEMDEMGYGYLVSMDTGVRWLFLEADIDCVEVEISTSRADLAFGETADSIIDDIEKGMKE